MSALPPTIPSLLQALVLQSLPRFVTTDSETRRNTRANEGPLRPSRYLWRHAKTDALWTGASPPASPRDEDSGVAFGPTAVIIGPGGCSGGEENVVDGGKSLGGRARKVKVVATMEKVGEVVVDVAAKVGGKAVGGVVTDVVGTVVSSVGKAGEVAENVRARVSLDGGEVVGRVRARISLDGSEVVEKVRARVSLDGRKEAGQVIFNGGVGKGKEKVVVADSEEEVLEARGGAAKAEVDAKLMKSDRRVVGAMRSEPNVHLPSLAPISAVAV